MYQNQDWVLCRVLFLLLFQYDACTTLPLCLTERTPAGTDHRLVNSILDQFGLTIIPNYGSAALKLFQQFRPRNIWGIQCHFKHRLSHIERAEFTQCISGWAEIGEEMPTAFIQGDPHLQAWVSNVTSIAGILGGHHCGMGEWPRVWINISWDKAEKYRSWPELTGGGLLKASTNFSFGATL